MRLLTLFAISLLLPITRVEAADANSLMSRNEWTNKFKTASISLTMTLINEDGNERIRELTAISKLLADGKHSARLLKFQSPADIKGTTTLLIEQQGEDDDIWIYLPALKKTRRLVAEHKKDSFVGSDLSFGDLLGHPSDEWQSTLLGEEHWQDKTVYRIESLPKTETVQQATGYSKRILWIDMESAIALKTEYWDENKQRLKTATTSNIMRIQGTQDKWQFMDLLIENHQTAHKTRMHSTAFIPDIELGDELFSANALEKAD